MSYRVRRRRVSVAGRGQAGRSVVESRKPEKGRPVAGEIGSRRGGGRSQGVGSSRPLPPPCPAGGGARAPARLPSPPPPPPRGGGGGGGGAPPPPLGGRPPPARERKGEGGG